MPLINIFIAMVLSMSSLLSSAEVKELNNTEMTEAFIEDGAIVIKQRAVKPALKKKVKITVGPGEPAISEAQKTALIEQSTTSQYSIIEQELNQDQSARQLETSDIYRSALTANIPDAINPAQQAQQEYAQSLVRNGLGLPSGTEITPVMMGDYLLTTYPGATYGAALGPQQTVTADGLQFTVPNPGGQFDIGVFPSGDNSMNVETTNTQLIFNLLFPTE